MKKLLLAVFFLGMLISCDQSEKKLYLKGSFGNPNTVRVIIEKDQWQGRVGDTLRKFLAAPVDGLPREEPLFTIDQIPMDAFTGDLAKSRIFLKVQRGDSSAISIERNITARPQTGITISGKDDEAIIDLIKANEEKIVKAFNGKSLFPIVHEIQTSFYYWAALMHI